jgi:glutaredoxin
MVWLTWLGLPLLAVLVGFRAGPLVGLFVLAVGIVAQVLYVRGFPRISVLMGYGAVADTPPPSGAPAAPFPHVTLYTASVCPFCPILRKRLADLRREVPFEVSEVDGTFRPDITSAKGLRSVPVLEANGRFLTGNATSAQIVEFLRSASNA